MQTNAGGKNKTPMLLAVRESPNLVEVGCRFWSTVVVVHDKNRRLRALATSLPAVASRPWCYDTCGSLATACLPFVYLGISGEGMLSRNIDPVCLR